MQFRDPDKLQDEIEDELVAGSTHSSSPARTDNERLVDDVQSKLPEQFEVISQLGHGGMGVVYKARNKFTDRLVAIKMLPPSIGSDESYRRFQIEAKATSAFTHPNAVALYDFGFCSDQSPYFVMEYVDGESLEDILHYRRRLDEELVSSIFRQVCNVLNHAHAAGVVHRDLKPSNLIIVDRSTVKVLDFGIAKIVNVEDVPTKTQSQKFSGYGGQADLTKTGTLMGTPLYMSPEQCTGDTIDRCSDIYSIGAVIYHCLTGQPPHLGATIFTTMQHRINDRVEPFPGSLKISPALEKVVLKCLERDPEKRYQTAAAILSDYDKLTKAKPSRSLLLATAAFLSIPLIAGAVYLSLQKPALQAEAPPVQALVIKINREVSDAEWKKLAADLKAADTNRTVNLQLANTNLDDEKIGWLKANVTMLDVSQTKVTDLNELVSNFPMLEELNLSGLHISNKDLSCLAQLKHLTDLNISVAQIEDKDLSFLSQMTQLRRLKLLRSKVGQQVYESIGRLTNLEKLDLFKSNVDDEAVRKLAGLTNLTELLLKNTAVTSPSMDVLAKFSKLERLDLNYTKVGDTGVLALQPLKHLQWIGLGGTEITNDSLKTLGTFRSLQELGIRDSKINDDTLTDLEPLTNLEKIFIRGSKISARGCETIQKILPSVNIIK